MESRFSGMRTSPVFENLVDLLKTKFWLEENFGTFGDAKLDVGWPFHRNYTEKKLQDWSH